MMEPISTNSILSATDRAYFLLFVQCLRVLQEVLHPFVLLFPKDDLDRLVYGMRQFFRVDRLQQIVERTEADAWIA